MTPRDTMILAWRIGTAARDELELRAPSAVRACSFSFDERAEHITFRAELDRELTDDEDHALWVAAIEVHTYSIVAEDAYIEMLTEIVPLGEPLRPLPGGIAFLRVGEPFDPAYPGAVAFMPPSFLAAGVDAQQLLDLYGGTSMPLGTARRGHPGFREWFDAPEPAIGSYRDPETRVEVPTTRATIHYSALGAHIIPTRPDDAGRPGADPARLIAFAARRALCWDVPASLLLFSFSVDAAARSILFRAVTEGEAAESDCEACRSVVTEVYADRIFGEGTTIALEIVARLPGEPSDPLPGGIAFRRAGEWGPAARDGCSLG